MAYPIRPQYPQYPAPKKPATNRGYACKACGGRHATHESLRDCWKEYYEHRGTYTDKSLIQPTAFVSGMEVDGMATWSSFSPAKILPTGSYLVMVNTPSGTQRSIHLRIGAISTGKWAGTYFISQYDEVRRRFSPIEDPISRETISKRLLSGNWQRAMCDYGRAFSECPICSKPLMPSELRNGIHAEPDCRNKVFPPK